MRLRPECIGRSVTLLPRAKRVLSVPRRGRARRPRDQGPRWHEPLAGPPPRRDHRPRRVVAPQQLRLRPDRRCPRALRRLHPPVRAPAHPRRPTGRSCLLAGSRFTFKPTALLDRLPVDTPLGPLQGSGCSCSSATHKLYVSARSIRTVSKVETERRDGDGLAAYASGAEVASAKVRRRSSVTSGPRIPFAT